MKAAEQFTANVVIGEDQTDLALGLSLLIDQQPDFRCVGHAASGAELLALFARHHIDACLLDLRLADGSSLPLIPLLRQQQPQCVILVTSGLVDAALQRECLVAGAHATWPKDGRVDLLLQQLRLCLAQLPGASPRA